MLVLAPNWTVITSTTVAQNYGFQDGRTDALIGDIRFGDREYRPSIEVWTGMDPIGFSGGLNEQEFVGDNPVDRTDPSGLFGFSSFSVDEWVQGRISALKQAAIDKAQQLAQAAVDAAVERGKAAVQGAVDRVKGNIAAANQAIDEANQQLRQFAPYRYSQDYVNSPMFQDAAMFSMPGGMVIEEGALGASAASKALAAAEAKALARLAARGKALGRIFKQHPPQSKQCQLAAEKALAAFTKAGEKATIVTVKDAGGAFFFKTKDGAVFSEDGVHKAVYSAGRIYDALTGANGMTIAEYMEMLKGLNLKPVITGLPQ